MFDTSGLVIDNEDEDDEEIINDEGEFNGDAVGVVAKVEQQNTSSSSSRKNSKINKATKQSSAKSNEKEKIVPSEKKSVYRDYSKEDEPKEKKPNKKKSTKCPFEKDHRKNGMNGLSEEQIVGNLDTGYLKGATCGACKKIIVSKNTLSEEEKEKETMFNTKLLLFTCENYRAANDISCKYCMCRQCYIDIYITDEKSYQQGTRRSGRNRK